MSEKLEPGDIVIYEPPDLRSADYNSSFINNLGVVTDEPINSMRTHPLDNEVHVRWITSSSQNREEVTRHYAKNLRKIGRIGEVVSDWRPDVPTS